MPMPAISPTTDIDSRVAQILGLDFTGDFTPGEYSSLLKEAMVRHHPDKGGDAEVFKLLSAERSSIGDRTKNANEKFKVTTKKITADGFKKGSSVGGAQKVAADTTGASALALRGSSALSTDVKSLEPGEKGGDNLTEFQGIIEKIAGTVDSIYDTLTDQGKRDKNKSKADAKDDQDRKRGLREKILESKGFKMIAKGVGKALAPVQSMFSKVVNFITSLIMGRVIVNIMKWWSDPANQDKANAIIRFASDWWPIFAAGFVIFGTGLGSLVAGLVAWATPVMGSLILATKALLLNPWVAGAVALGLGAWGIHSLVSGKGEKPPAKSGGDDGGVNTEQSTEIRQGATQDRSNANQTEAAPGFATGGLVTQPREYSSGGRVSGPGGVDKVPARLTAGEFVMSKGAVNKWGAGTLAAMNAMGGGTNRPKMGGYEGGGQVPAVPGNEKFFDTLMTVQQFLIQNVGSSTSTEEVGRVVEGARRITSTVSSIMSSPNISSASSIEPPTPPVETEQEVVVTPVTPPPTDATPTTGEISNTIPPFSATPSGNAMHNKVKVLGFVR